MSRFADVLDRLATGSGITNLRWVTVQNEPNGPPPRGRTKTVTPGRLVELYELLDGRLAKRGLRRRMRFMGGDLVEGSPDPASPLHHRRWLEQLSRHPAGLFDAYSVHVYWDYDDVDRFQDRLTEVRAIADGLPERKPLYVTEYGVRGKDRRESGAIAPGSFHDGGRRIPLGRTNVAAFQHAWFQIRAAQLGYAGTVKWDCYFGRYDRGRQAYYAIGEPGEDGWPLYPVYFLLQLFTRTTDVGWRVLALDPAGGTKQLVAFEGPSGELTILGLDSRGATINGRSPRRVSYSIAGLPPRTPLALLLWNPAGDGKLAPPTTVRSDAKGIARFGAPLHSVFALTTKAAGTLSG